MFILNYLRCDRIAKTLSNELGVTFNAMYLMILLYRFKLLEIDTVASMMGVQRDSLRRRYLDVLSRKGYIHTHQGRLLLTGAARRILREYFNPYER